MSFTRHPTLTFDFCVYFIFIWLQLNQPSIDNFQERRYANFFLAKFVNFKSIQLTLSVNVQ